MFIKTTKKLLFFLLFVFCFNNILVLISIAESTNNAYECKLPSNIKLKRPYDGIKPTLIYIELIVFDIKEIIDINQTFIADFLIEFEWNDPRLSKEILGKTISECEISINEIWFPNFIILNETDRDQKLNFVRVDDLGNVKYVQRVLSTFSSDFIYTDFPFDDQILKVSVGIYDNDDNEVDIKLDKENINMSNIFSLEGWEISLLDPKIHELDSNSNKNFSKIDIKFNAHRVRGYYIWKIIVPLGLIVLMAWAVFWIPPTQIGPQVGLSTATIFTLIAYRFSIGYQLPKIPYFTRMDKYVFMSTLIVFIALGTAISTSYLASKGKEELALRIEEVSRVIYIILFIAIITFSFFI